MAVHDIMKSFPCNQCEKTFTSSQGVKMHENRMHKGMRYSCNKCNCEKSWSTTDGLKRHILKVHFAEKKDYHSKMDIF